jgi:zinc transport system substrate-binding protein
MRIVCTLACGLVLAALVVGCRSSSDDDGRLDVVAAFYPLAFAAETIGGDGVKVTNLTPPGAEPHDVELSPQDVAHIQRADVVLYLSHGFQPAVEEALGDAQGTSVDGLDGIVLRRGSGSEARTPDPHVWLNPVWYSLIATRIGAALGTPERVRDFVTALHRLDGEYRRGLARCERRELVTTHASFGYLADRYHLRQVAISGIEPEAEPSAQTLANLVERVRRDGVTTVFFEPLVSPRVAETVAREAGVKTAVLDPIEGLTEDEADRGENYFTLMRKNLAALRKALGCR